MTSHVTIRAAAAQHVSASAAESSVDEQTPLLPSRSPSPTCEVDHWDRDHAGNRMRRYNVPHHLVRHWVPRALQPERAGAAAANVPPFVVTPEDAVRGASITAATQVLLGTFFVAGAIDAFAPVGPSFTNPSGQYNPRLGSACVVGAALGYTFVGAAIGNLWYNALLKLTAVNHAAIASHRRWADNTAAVLGVSTIAACVVGAILLGADLLDRAHRAPPEGAAAPNAMYEYTLAMLALTVGPSASACSAWYIGRTLGGVAGSVLSSGDRSDAPSDLFVHDDLA